MFTSRAEYRLTLRADNADIRLSSIAKKIGCLSKIRAKNYENKVNNINKVKNSLSLIGLTPNQAKKHNISISMDGVRRNGVELMGYKNVTYEKLRLIFNDLPDATEDVINHIKIDNHYRGYYSKQESDIRKFKKDEGLKIPENIDYDKISGLTAEVKKKLELIKPETFGQAMRMEGMTPAAINLLLAYTKRYKFKQSA